MLGQTGEKQQTILEMVLLGWEQGLQRSVESRVHVQASLTLPAETTGIQS